MKKIIACKLISWLSITIILCTTMFSGCVNSNKDNTQVKICEYVAVGDDITEQVKELAEDVTLLESSEYRLMIEASGILKVVDKNDRILWSTGTSSMKDASGNESLSSAVIKYNINNIGKELDSFSGSYDKQQFRIYRKENTITYEQIIGDFVADMLIPEALTEERYNDIISKMSKKEASYISRQYTLYTPDNFTNDILEKIPNIKNKAYYILMDNDSYSQRTRIHDAFTAAGYTKNDLKLDREGAGIELKDQGEVFKLVMNFTLEDNELTVEIPCDQLYYPDSMPIETAKLFKYGQFAPSGSNGSYIVPSGSGAQFDFLENKKVNYKLQFDGKDYSNIDYAVDVDYSGHPVFGALYGDVGCVGIIEEGSEVVRLNIESVSGGYIQYPELMLTPFMIANAGRGSTLYAKESFGGNVKIRYSFLSDADANYSKMAEYYREYLESEGSFENKMVKSDVPFEAEVINSIYVKDYIAGVSYNTEKVLTSFDETKDIMQWLYENNVDNIWLKLSGANKRGLFAQEPGKFKISNKSGGKKSYIDLKHYCQEIKSQMFLSVNIPFYLADKWNDGYYPNKDTSRFLNQKQVQLYTREKSTLEKRTDLPILEVTTPSNYMNYANNYIEISNTIGSGISVGEFARILNSDFVADKYVSRAETKKTTKETLEALQKSYNVLAENPSCYSIGSVFGIEKMPLSSTGYEFFERDVPFIPLSIHGKIQYTSTYWNDQPDTKKAQLKAIEYGSGIAYRFANNISKEDVEDHNSFLYNVDYLLWRETAVENYKYISKALEGLNNVTMKEHSYVTETLVKVEYENGTVIYINYDDVPVDVDGFTVEANSYFRV